MQLSIHNVTAIELATSYKANGNSRTIRISYSSEIENGGFDLVVYGETDALDALPKAADFVAHGRKGGV
jgi:hypothetical protein